MKTFGKKNFFKKIKTFFFSGRIFQPTNWFKGTKFQGILFFFLFKFFKVIFLGIQIIKCCLLSFNHLFRRKPPLSVSDNRISEDYNYIFFFYLTRNRNYILLEWKRYILSKGFNRIWRQSQTNCLDICLK